MDSPPHRERPKFQDDAGGERYFQDGDDLAHENTRIWEEHYRSRPLYDHIETWQQWLGEYRQLIIEVQELYEIHTA